MYNHLLVPVDDTPLSSANVAASVELARTWQARITFLHATADLGATEEGSLMQSLDPALFAQQAPGETNSVLAKAIAAARGAGVACSSAARISDHPAAAIVQAAKEAGCDLIVMASRGSSAGRLRNWLRHSETEQVLRHSPVALLVTRVEAAHPLSDGERAIGMIVDEHRSIAVVVGAMRDIARELSEAGVSDAALGDLAGMLSYLREYPERIHHPKEEEFLHRWMRARDPSCDGILQKMEEQHELEERLIERVAACLKAVGGSGGVLALHDAVMAFVNHVFDHLNAEEAAVLPLARKCLMPADWALIAEAFSGNDDSRFSELSTREFRRMFTQVSNGIAARHRHI